MHNRYDRCGYIVRYSHPGTDDHEDGDDKNVQMVTESFLEPMCFLLIISMISSS